MNADSKWSKQEAWLHVQIRCGLLSITTTVALLVNEFLVRCILHEQVRLAAVNHIYDFHEVMNGYSVKACFENVNIINMDLSCG